jgi:hypothetical protein
MDGSRFDDLLRAGVSSRRGTLKLLLALAAGGFGAAATGAAEAKSKKPFHHLGNPCLSDADCGLYTACVAQLGVSHCISTNCVIHGHVYGNGDTNPDNGCEFCKTGLSHLKGATSWHTQKDGVSCPAGAVSNPCKSAFGATCQAGVCTPPLVADGIACGDSSNPCTALTCQSGDCVEGAANDGADCDNGVNGVCVDRFGACAGGVCIGNQEPDGSSCGFDEVCCDGICCSAGQICDAARHCANVDPDPGEGCQGQACNGTCVIGGVTYDFGEHNPDNNCQVCGETPFNPTTYWLAADDATTACGEEPVIRACCSGVCCPAGECCVIGVDGYHCSTNCPPPTA